MGLGQLPPELQGEQIQFPGGIITLPRHTTPDESEAIKRELLNYWHSKNGVWVTYYYDRSGFAIFNTEINALRYAFENRYDAVVFWEFGKNWTDITSKKD